MKVSFSPDIIHSGWQRSKHQFTHQLPCLPAFLAIYYPLAENSVADLISEWVSTVALVRSRSHSNRVVCNVLVFTYRLPVSLDGTLLTEQCVVSFRGKQMKIVSRRSMADWPLMLSAVWGLADGVRRVEASATPLERVVLHVLINGVNSRCMYSRQNTFKV